MTNKKNTETTDNYNTDSYDYLGKSASAHDCTGLIPTPADSFEERQSYQSLYPFQAPVTDIEKSQSEKTKSEKE